MKPAAILLLLALPVLSLPGSAGQVYRWTDAHGKTFFSDQPPPPGAKNAKEQNFKTGAKTAADTPKVSVTLYATPTCGKPCDDAKSYLAKRSVTYTSKDPATDVAANEALRANGGTPRVPTLMLDGDKLEGFSESAWNYALNKAGFPKIDGSNNPSGDKNPPPAKP